MGDAGEIQVALVHADLLNVRRIGVQELHQPSAVLVIQGMVRRLHVDVRTLPQGICHRLSGVYPVLFCRDRFGQHYAVSGFPVPAYDSGNGPDIKRGAAFQLLYSSPAQVRRIDIDMEYNAGHRLSSSPPGSADFFFHCIRPAANVNKYTEKGATPL